MQRLLSFYCSSSRHATTPERKKIQRLLSNTFYGSISYPLRQHSDVEGGQRGVLAHPRRQRGGGREEGEVRAAVPHCRLLQAGV
jgi:hypothetical protein